MKRYIKSTIPALEGYFPVEIKYHDTSDQNQDVVVKMSYKTALLFVDGVNVCSYYPKKTDNPEFWVKELMEECATCGHPIDETRAYELAEYMISNVR